MATWVDSRAAIFSSAHVSLECFFAVIVLNKHLPGGETISMTVVCTIILSVVGHGLSANPLVAALGARIKARENAE